MTITDICNIALDRAEMEMISSYDDDMNDNAKRCQLLYPVAANAVLRSHEWQGAIDFATLGPAEYTRSYTGTATGNDSGDADFVVDEAIDSITPYSGVITIDGDEYNYVGWDTSTFTLKSGETLSSTYDETDECVLTPNNKNDRYDRMYAIPSGVLEILDLDDDPEIEFESEGGYVYTGAYDATYGVRARYLKDIRSEVSSAVVYADHVADAISAELARRLPKRTAKNVSLIRVLTLEAEDALVDAQALDSRKRFSEPVEKTKWVDQG